ncbi:MAG: EAL domain-containing protein, partial [Synergistaceae bacterium]|nr:EAL domain-containing protein [Synergistaceae bacterium]
LSRLDFELTDVVRVINDAVERNNISPDMLRFELTESLIAVDMDAMKHEADRLRQHGFKVWMDAFGAGYSSLKVLKDFSLDGLKIDMDMIKSVNNERAYIITSAVIEMAKKLGIPALSKGVETQEQLDFLKSVGCDLAQGFLFGKPAPIKD